MKRILQVLIVIVGLMTYPAMAAPPDKYVGYLSISDAITASGNTTSTAATTGVSVFYLRGVGLDRSKSMTAIHNVDQLGSGIWIAQIKNIDIQQVSSGTSSLVTGLSDFSSGSTFEIGYRCAEDAGSLSSAQLKPIWNGMALNSAETPWQRTVIIPPTKIVEWYFKPTGATAFNNAEIELIAGIQGSTWKEPETARLGLANVYLINVNSGVSSLASIPAGTRVTTIRITGSDIRYRTDGVNPDNNSGPQLTSGQQLTLDSYQQANDFRFREITAGTGTTVFAEHYNK